MAVVEEDFQPPLNTTFQGKELLGKMRTIPGNYLAYYDNIYKAIRNDQALQVSAEQARDVIRVIEAAYRSSREGQVVYL